MLLFIAKFFLKQHNNMQQINLRLSRLVQSLEMSLAPLLDWNWSFICVRLHRCLYLDQFISLCSINRLQSFEASQLNSNLVEYIIKYYHWLQRRYRENKTENLRVKINKKNHRLKVQSEEEISGSVTKSLFILQIKIHFIIQWTWPSTMYDSSETTFGAILRL